MEAAGIEPAFRSRRDAFRGAGEPRPGATCRRHTCCQARHPSSDRFLACSRMTGRAQCIRFEETSLVCEDDGLHAVAEPELLKDMSDVSLDGGLADEELVRDLRVRETVDHQTKDVVLAATEFLELRGR